MLIRSQNKELLSVFDRTPAIGILETGNCGAKVTCSDTDETLDLGSYSTKEKALKVLDMLQEAYAECEILRMMFAGIASVRITASEVDGVEALKKEIQEKIIFQMPTDGEVEV